MLLCTQKLTNTLFRNAYIYLQFKQECLPEIGSISLQFIFTEKKKMFVDRMSGNSLTTRNSYNMSKVVKNTDSEVKPFLQSNIGPPAPRLSSEL